MTDLSKLSINELISLQEQIDSEINSRRTAEKTKAQKEILDLASRYGLAVQFAGGKAPKPKATVAAKYRHPENPSLTWTGRGRSPLWVSEWQAKHGSLDGITL